MITRDDIAAGLDNPYALAILITISVILAAWALIEGWTRLIAAVDRDIDHRVAEALNTIDAEPITWDNHGGDAS